VRGTDRPFAPARSQDRTVTAMAACSDANLKDWDPVVPPRRRCVASARFGRQADALAAPRRSHVTPMRPPHADGTRRRLGLLPFGGR